MAAELTVGVIGDFNPSSLSHAATNEALAHAAAALGMRVAVSWIPTHTLTSQSAGAILGSFDALWCSPGSPYGSMSGAIAGIRFAREKGWPFFGT
jgi:CTP synthase (UTP-ammonia lyase)